MKKYLISIIGLLLCLVSLNKSYAFQENLKLNISPPSNGRENKSDDIVFLKGIDPSIVPAFSTDAFFNGTYSIGPTGDFATFNAALSAVMIAGVDGPVVFNVAPGVYTEQLTITQILGASAINTITFQSTSGNYSDVVLQYAATGTADNFIIKLDGADYFYFNNMTIQATGTSFGNVLVLGNVATYNVFNGNRIIGVVAASNITDLAVIYSASGSNSADSVNTFSNNIIENGSYGMFYSGTSTSVLEKATIIYQNHFLNQYTSGISIYNQEDTFIGNNFFTTNTSSTNYKALYIYQCYNNLRVTCNKIELINGGFGIYTFYCYASLGNESTIDNNMISIGGTNESYGILITSSSFQNIYFNSINLYADNANIKALYVNGGSSIILVDNNFAYTGMNITGYAIYTSSTTAIISSHNNNLYSNGTNLGYWGANKASLVAYQVASGMEQHSISINPPFVSQTDLHTNQFSFCHAGCPITGITNDFDGDTRDVFFPCIGADEVQSGVTVDAGMFSIDPPVSPATPGAHDFYAKIINCGQDTLTSVSINWDINGTPCPTYYWSGLLATGDTSTNILIGSAIIHLGGDFIKIWTSMPNGVADVLNSNDTLTTNVTATCGPMSGNYTIGVGNFDFQTFNTALYGLTHCGVNGHIVFDVADGSYEEQLTIPSVAGVGPGSTVTFQSASGNSDNVILYFAATNTATNYVLKLNGTDYFRFRNMTIQTTTLLIESMVILMTNNADHNEFTGNKILANFFTSIPTSAIYSPNGSCDFNRFINNKIDGGAYTVFFTGISGSYLHNNEFIGNEITGYNEWGLYIGYNDSVIVRGNSFSNSPASKGSSNLYLTQCINGCRVENNKICCTAGNFRGIEIGGCNGTASEPLIVANNMITYTNNDSCSNTAYGIYLIGNYINIFNNSVYISSCFFNPTFENSAFYYYSGSNIRLLNNIFVKNGDGFAYYAYTPSGIIQSDYNLLLSTGAFLAHWNGDKIDLSTLQAASGFETNSISFDPVFHSQTDLHINSPGANNTGISITEITEDFDGEPRDISTPDIGADEFTPEQNDIAIIDFQSPGNAFSVTGSLDTVCVTVRNIGTDTVYSFNISYKYDSMPPVNATWNGTLPHGQTIVYSFPVFFTRANGHVPLCVYTEMTGDADPLNDTLVMNCISIQLLSLPYCDNFESNDIWGTYESNAIWEYGIPASLMIDSAYSPDHCWKTNLEGYYLPSHCDNLYTPFFDFSQVTDATLDFWHWYQTTTDNDGCNIQYSIDGGTTWVTLGHLSDPDGINWYNDNFYTPGLGSNNYWTGSSNTWIHSNYDLGAIPAIMYAQSPVQFKMQFNATSLTDNLDGWAIDDFCINSTQASNDAGVINILNPSGPTGAGANVMVQVALKNFGADTLFSFPVAYNINGGALTQQLWTGLLIPGDTVNFAFSVPYTSPNGNYQLCAKTMLPSDAYSANDQICIYPESIIVGIENNSLQDFSLFQNTPNPASNITSIAYKLPFAGEITFVVRDIVGRTIMIKTLEAFAGLNNIELDFSDIRNGVYFYTLEFEGRSITKKMFVSK
jgi:hypothetical protein